MGTAWLKQSLEYLSACATRVALSAGHQGGRYTSDAARAVSHGPGASYRVTEDPEI
jgi:hypothetical protein